MLLVCRQRRALLKTQKELTVVSANTKTTSATPTEMPDLAQKLREQLMSALQQGQKLSIDAAQTWVKAVSVLPAMDLPKLPGVPAMPGIEAATTFTFDVVTDLLNAQREFALELTQALSPVKTS
jgi:hypothetical protein